MHGRTQRAVLGVAHHRQVARHTQRELPSGLAVRQGCSLGFGQHVVRHTRERGPVVDVERPGVGRVEQVVVEPRRELRELLFDRFEARFLRIRKLGAAQPEIAQLVIHRASFRRVERRVRRRRGKRAITAEQPEVLRHVSVKRGDLRQVRVVGIAQTGRAHHGVEVLDGAPRAAQPVECVGERLADRVPRGGRRVRGNRVDRRARDAHEQVHRRRHVLGPDGIEAGQARKVEQRIGVGVGIHADLEAKDTAGDRR